MVLATLVTDQLYLMQYKEFAYVRRVIDNCLMKELLFVNSVLNSHMYHLMVNTVYLTHVKILNTYKKMESVDNALGARDHKVMELNVVKITVVTIKNFILMANVSIVV